MAKPELFHRQFSNGKESKEWYFRVSINSVRKTVNTGTANKQKALLFMNKWLIGENATKTISQKAINKTLANETLPEVLDRTGWLNAKRNPKYLKAQANQKNFGLVQAKKISNSLTHMFIDVGDVDTFATYLRVNKIIKNNKIDDYVDLATKPFHQLTRDDASRFTNFIHEYCNWLKVNKKKPGDMYFMCQARINIVALKSFYTHSTDVRLAKDNIFKNEDIPKPSNKENKPKFTPEQINLLFNKDFAKYISDKEFKGFSSSPQFRAYAFMAYTGMRSGEVRALRWKQISDDNKVVVIDSAFKLDSTKKELIGLPKWDKVRSIVLSDLARECLGERESGNEFVFKLKGGGAIGSSKFIKDFKRYIAWVEIEVRRETKRRGEEKPFTSGKAYTPHCFRGTLNSLLVNRAFVNESLVQGYLGWSIGKLTEVQKKYYTEFDKVGMWKVANEIQKFFTGEPLSWTIEDDKVETDFLSIADSIIKRNDVDTVGFNPVLNKRVAEMGTYDDADVYNPKVKNQE